MQVTQLYIYPVKSIRGSAVQHATITGTGFKHDRQFMLLKVESDGKLRNMHVPHFPSMSLFSTELGENSVLVTFTPPVGTSPMWKSASHIKIPLTPDIAGLETFEVIMHSSATMAYAMPAQYSEWFSRHFGFDVKLAYIGDNTRPVLGTLSPNRHRAATEVSWYSSLKSAVGLQAAQEESRITFADCANFLLVTEKSLQEASSRLPDGVEMDITKFRPNIVVSGADGAWDEDYWAEIALGDVRIEFTANCVRCASINVDYETGTAGAGPAGQMLKKLQGDRRVDVGAKYSPVFGRYGYATNEFWGREVRVGGEVEVSRRNVERTRFDWPGIGGVPAL